MLNTLETVNRECEGDRDDEALLEQAVAGNGGAFRMLLVRMRPAMSRRIRFVVRRRQRYATSPDASDILQHALLVALKRGPCFLAGWRKGVGLSVRNYFGLFAERVARSWFKSGRLSGWAERQVPPDTLDDERASVPCDWLENRDQLRRLWAALCAHLDDSSLELFYAIMVEDTPPPVLCESLNVTANSIYCARYRFRELARALEQRFSRLAGSPLQRPIPSSTSCAAVRSAKARPQAGPRRAIPEAPC